jgi:hypothetical protein
MLQRKFDLTVPGHVLLAHSLTLYTSAEEFRIDLALSNPDIGPQSKPSARATMMKYAPCSELLRFAVASASSGLFANRSREPGLWRASWLASGRSERRTPQSPAQAQTSSSSACPTRARDATILWQPSSAAAATGLAAFSIVEESFCNHA